MKIGRNMDGRVDGFSSLYGRVGEIGFSFVELRPWVWH